MFPMITGCALEAYKTIVFGEITTSNINTIYDKSTHLEIPEEFDRIL